MKNVLFIVAILFTIISCSGDKEPNFPKISPQELQEQLLQANKNALSLEKKQIEAYVDSLNLNVITTKTGLRYEVYKDVEGDSIKNNQLVAINYNVKLLDGTECYNTKNEPEEFRVGKDYVESGLHEAIQYLSKGDKAIIIIPSHLGHGLAGDFKKIPIRSTIVYDLEVIDVK